MATRVPDAVRNAIVDAIVDRLDAGPAAGKIRIYTGAQPADADDAPSGTLLADIALPDPAFGNAANGSASANAIPSDTVDVTGVAGWFRALDSQDNRVLDGSVSAVGGGGDMKLGSTNLQAGADVDISTWTVTMPGG